MPNQPTPGRIPELDGLRGLAILLVVMEHYSSFPLGWSGVDLFFVLSGFLIGGILLDVRESPRYFKTFYARRFFRIIPVYYAWIVGYILLVSAAALLRIAPRVIHKVDFQILSHFLFLQTFAGHYSDALASTWFVSTWSLAVEEQFYLVAPLLVRLLSRRTLAISLSAVVLGAPLLRASLRLAAPTDPWLIYIAMPCRADALAWGVLVALLWRNTRLRDRLSASKGTLYGVFGVLLIGVFVLWKWFPDVESLAEQTVGYSWIGLFYATLLFLLLLEAGKPVTGVARMAWLRELGSISYCVYLIHWTVYFFCNIALRHLAPNLGWWQDWAVALPAVILTYAIAKLSLLLFEQPLLRRGHTFKY